MPVNEFGLYSVFIVMGSVLKDSGIIWFPFCRENFGSNIKGELKGKDMGYKQSVKSSLQLFRWEIMSVWNSQTV